MRARSLGGGGAGSKAGRRLDPEGAGPLAGPVRVLIVGCGYVGLELGRRLAGAGAEVLGLRRSSDADAEMRAAGIRPVRGDVARADDLEALPGRFDHVVDVVSSSGGGADAYRSAYLEGARNLVAWAARHRPTSLVYTGSTSVYGQTDGAEVDEASETNPSTETGRILLETEAVFLRAARERGVPAVVLRVAGIYGPGRGHLLAQFLAGEARREPEPGRWVNMIHRDDVASAILAAMLRGRPGEVYNAVDDVPVRQPDLLAHFARELRRPSPPVAGPDAAAPRRRGVTDKRVSNRRFRAGTGWVPAYPSYREGYAAEIARVAPPG
jgi:nucleoside-diphosphate-sugar epimerase